MPLKWVDGRNVHEHILPVDQLVVCRLFEINHDVAAVKRHRDIDNMKVIELVSKHPHELLNYQHRISRSDNDQSKRNANCEPEPEAMDDENEQEQWK